MSQEHKKVSSRKVFSEHDLERIRRLEDEQNKFRDRLKARGNFTQKEEAAFNIDSHDAFQLFWREISGTRASFDAQRTHGSRKAAKKTLDFMASADDMLKGFKPIVQVIQDFGSPYGGLAIGTVCFLFAVAKSRRRMEEQITKTLSEIRDRLPGLEMYKDVYRADNELERMIQSKIVDAYESFIHFCIQATYFYTQTAWRRWLMAIAGSGNLDNKACDVQDAVVAIRRIGEELVARNVDHITTQNKDLKRQIQELQYSQDSQNLDGMRQRLELEPFSLDVHRERLAAYRKDIAAEFDDSDFSDKSFAERLQVVQADPDFQDWMNHHGSRLLVLSGRNYVSESTHCWASPVALDLIAKLTKPDTSIASDELRGQDPPLDNVCIFHASPPCDDRYTFPGVVTELVYQLLQANKLFLRNEKQATALQADLEQYLVRRKRVGPVSALEGPLKRLTLTALDFFSAENKIVWIVLDRVDRCITDVSESGRRMRDVHRRTLLHMFARVVQETCATVKVLAVVNSVDWDVETLEEDFGRSKEERACVVVREIREEEVG